VQCIGQIRRIRRIGRIRRMGRGMQMHGTQNAMHRTDRTHGTDKTGWDSIGQEDTMRKSAPFGADFHCVMPVSRILYRTPEPAFDDMHLSSPAIARRVKRHFRIAADTALHRGKDFAVSLLHFCKTIPCGILRLSPLASLLAPLGLLSAGVTRYLSPVRTGGDVRTFLPDVNRSAYPA
jgi:hypothetical protein